MATDSVLIAVNMKNDLTVINPRLLVTMSPPPDRRINNIMARCLALSVMGSPTGDLINKIEPEERKVLTKRKDLLMEFLRYSDRKKIAAAVATMLMAYPKYQGMDAETFQDVITIYVNELTNVPTFSVQEACKAIRAGKAPSNMGISMAYPPSTIQVYVLAQHYAAPHRHELATLELALRAKLTERTASPEERETILNGFAALSAELRGRIAAREAQKASQTVAGAV